MHEAWNTLYVQVSGNFGSLNIFEAGEIGAACSIMRVHMGSGT